MNINDSLEAKDSQSFNVDTMVMTKHTVIRPMSKDMRRHARKNMLDISLFYYSKTWCSKLFKTKFNCQRHELICIGPMPK